MKKDIIKTELMVNNNSIRIIRLETVDYISLTDLAKYQNPIEPSDVIRNWMSSKDLFVSYSL